jgi:hypothetical protein
MLLVWTIAWSIFTANPLAAFIAEQEFVRTTHEQADIDARLLSSSQAVQRLTEAPRRMILS